ncbi:MAG: biopolymer transporter ExbD [Alcanivorax borkumensis]|uniref:Biopolymer transport protein ExbD n=1 Tax=Alcanivorax borkumensis (strain ATCC 700651 / DSM 11573 / NCIMB 13689 / SK2) TaxID=393595 RepID=Q0VQP6_ALCBS|nr:MULTISPECIES: biopolymer transporter ExbD [Alcanivorax]OJH07427.1 MAG: biopolymer transporter ExbD [Alcanivorax borkumensis]EUC71505.1 biopolymer transporter ExbD [Alcanivorax sp. 97CO-5]PKG02933.1 biopolymer transporter ExbD [Alcanivorax sp. 97CO-6]CAL16502.1 biopolymer transport protein ExbD [Alcanivorax borkumensis SK2]BAP13971.1 biopolymer transport protein ExbD [Alcanivorax sp. NBRC 101098]
MKFPRPSQEEISVNLTPLIDVVFLLLIFFMVSTTFDDKTQLSITLPEADGVPLAQINDQVEVTITSTGDYLVNGERLTASDSNSLRTALLRLGQDKVNYPLQIYADANVAYQAVVRVYDVAGQLGFVKLSLTTRESPNEAQ